MQAAGSHHAALMLAVLSSLCFGTALVTSRVGLRTLEWGPAVAISIPTALLLFVVASPFVLDLDTFNVAAALVFVGVGLFFPALVTIITFKSTALLGPTVTGTVSGTAPLFALLAASTILGEHIPKEAVVASVAVLAGVAMLSRSAGLVRPDLIGWVILLPLFGALVRGIAQVGAKAGLLLWPDPFAASLIAYSMSSATVIGLNRARVKARPKVTRQNLGWFMTTGALNGTAVLLMYVALNTAPVSLVAPVVASYPLFTALVSALVLKEEALTLRILVAGAVTLAAIIYLIVSTAQ